MKFLKFFLVIPLSMVVTVSFHLFCDMQTNIGDSESNCRGNVKGTNSRERIELKFSSIFCKFGIFSL